LIFPFPSLTLRMQKFTINRKESGLFTELSNALTYNQEAFQDLITAPFSAAAFDTQIQTKGNYFTPQKRQTLATVLKQQYAGFPAAPKVGANIDALTDENTFTVTTGHQLNLLTGPVYFIYKILHVIRLAEELEASHPGKKIVPVFWMASEDHDFEEINHTSLFGKPIVWDQPQGGPVGLYELEEWDIFKDAAAAYFQSQLDSEVNQTLKKYTGKNLSEATKSLVHALFSEYGLVIVEPNDPILKKEFAGIMAQEVQTSFAEKAVLDANRQIEEMGYKPQVFPRPINLFYIQKGVRDRLVPQEDQIRIAATGAFSSAEIVAQIAANPENFSPNVVLRPVYQEHILPNLAYIGGGGEMAYWIQLKGVFEAAGVPFPLIQVRNSLQLIDPNTQKKMNKLGLEPKGLFRDIEVLKKEYVLAHASAALDFDKLDELTNALSAQLTTQINQVESGLQAFAAAETTKLQKQLEGVKAKLIKQQKGQFDAAMKQIEDVMAKMFPNQGVQERTENFFSFCANGQVASTISTLKDAIDPFEKDLILLNLD
jgi:bacillithiol biosynthesis cysteine-adding enzyme BshC